PMYNVGDYILVKKVTPSDLKPGDVISFYSQDPSILGMPNTHQIVRIEDSGEFITQGLANNKEDDYPVPAQNVIGVVKKKITLLSFISPLLSNPFLLIMLLIIPIVILWVVQLVFLKKDSEKK
ncbi:MAG: signal peptidase I, partial [Oscillospiraceae bacterium]